MQDAEDIILWLAMRQIPGIGVTSLRRHWQEKASIQQVWEEIGIKSPQAEQVLDSAKLQFDKAVSQNVQILTLQDSAYPSLLRDLADIPPILFAKGNLAALNSPIAAIVGTRHPTRYGVEITKELTSQFVSLQYTVVSGMAKGIDAIAHQAALDHNGCTIAVWGSGLDCIYPPEHKALAQKIVERGAILSPFPMGTQAQAFTFPERNKVIAALSRIIIVTEAKIKSGSLLTAEAGIRYGRQVGAVPGSIYNIGSAGPHRLIAGGAKLVVDAADIVDTTMQSSPAHYPNHPLATPVSASEQGLLDLLQPGPLHVDELIRLSTISSAEVVSALTMLELNGIVKQLGPGEYVVSK